MGDTETGGEHATRTLQAGSSQPSPHSSPEQSSQPVPALRESLEAGAPPSMEPVGPPDATRSPAGGIGGGRSSGRGSRIYAASVAASCAVGLVVRLVYAFGDKYHDVWQGDSYYYHYQAKYLLKGWWFINPGVLHHHGTPRVELFSAQHPPAFTSFLAFFDLFGLHRLGAQKLLMCLVGVATIWAVSALARELAGVRAGVIAAVLGALYPGMWVFDGQVMSEALLMLLAALTLLAAYRCRRDPRPWRLLLLGAGTALCALTRSEAILYIPLIALPVAWGIHRSLGARARSTALALGAAVLVLLPWTVRNLVVFEHPVFLSDQLGITLAAANNKTTYSNGPLFASWCFPCVHDVKEPVADESVQQVFWEHEAENFVKHHLSRVPAVVAARVGITWSLYAPRLQASENVIQGWPVAVSLAWLWWYYPLALLAILGAVVLRRRRIAIYPLMAVPITVTAASIVTYGNLRFRAEAEVVIVTLAAVCLDAVSGWVAARAGWRQ